MTRAALGLLLVAALSIGVLAQSAPELYQQALVQEHANGDLGRAITLYEQTIRTAAGNRALAARALLRMAGAQEKLGKSAEASAAYGNLVREYPDQRTAAAAAQERLAALRRSPPADAGGGTVAGSVSVVVRPAIDRYCSSCHNARVKAAGLDFDAAVRQPIAGNTALWEPVVRRLKARRDPPAGAPRPDDAGYRTVIAAIERALDAHYAAQRASLPFERASDAVLAARLATFIWNGPPDQVLLAAAARGDLRSAASLRPQIVRMLRDPRSGTLVDGFFSQWLSLDRLRATAGTWPSLKADADLLQAMQTETRLFLLEQLRDDRDAAELWTANYTYVNERLARHYGLAGIQGPEFRRVVHPDAQRRGLLGQAGPLAMLAINGRTSPTVRGLYVLTRFLGLDAPPPPANVPPLAEEPAGQLGSMRDRIGMHKTNPSCASCHAIFDPLGLAFENFDALGAWRLTDGGARIDASGVFADGATFDGPAGLRARLLAHRDAYYTAVTRQLMAAALNRQGMPGRIYDAEMADVRAALREAAGHEYRWSALLAGVAASGPFQMKEVGGRR